MSKCPMSKVESSKYVAWFLQNKLMVARQNKLITVRWNKAYK